MSKKEEKPLLATVAHIEVIKCMCGSRPCTTCGGRLTGHLFPPQFVRCPHCGIALGSCSLNPQKSKSR